MQETAVAPERGRQLVVPELLLLPCEELPLARDGRMSSLLQNHVEVVQQYYACADRHRALAGWARERGRKEPVDGDVSIRGAR